MILDNLITLGKIRKRGHDAAYDGQPISDCPYLRFRHREAWRSGWRHGFDLRQQELLLVIHPELVEAHK